MDADIIRDLAAQEIELLAREFHIQVELAIAHPAAGGAVVDGGVEIHLVETGIGIVEELLITDQVHIVIGAPVGQAESAIGLDVFRADPLITVRGDDVVGHRECGVVGQQARQVGRRIDQRYFQRALVNGPHTDLARINLAPAGLFNTGDREQQRDIGRARVRVGNAAPGKDEILCRHRLAIRPIGGAQGEGPGQAVFRRGPAFRHARDRLAVRVLGEEPHEHVADDIVFPGPRRAMRVERERFGIIAAMQHKRI